jgi:hypothetical protein
MERRKQMKPSTIFLLLLYISVILYQALRVWVVVSFLIYLFKDIPFDFVSLVFMCVAWASSFIFRILLEIEE